MTIQLVMAGAKVGLLTGAVTAAVVATDAIDADALATTAVAEITGTVANTGGTATLGAVLGDPKNSSLADLLFALGAARVSKGITYTGATSYAAYTVTGTVAVKVVGSVTSALTDHADTTSVGTATSAAGLIAATAGSAMQTVGQAWVDNAPSKFETFPANWIIVSESIVVASTANITRRQHCQHYGRNGDAQLLVVSGGG